MKLKIEILTYWHPGTGRGLGSYLDAVTHRNHSGLPCLPGRSIKGLLRDAVQRWEAWGGYAVTSQPTLTEQLFGPHDTGTGVPTWPGYVRCGDACLPEVETQLLQENAAWREELYREHFSTAIETATGTALAKSLRGIEVIIPLTLYAPLSTVPQARYPRTDWADCLRQALPLIQAVGTGRTRGLGRANLTLEGMH